LSQRHEAVVVPTVSAIANTMARDRDPTGMPQIDHEGDHTLERRGSGWPVPTDRPCEHKEEQHGGRGLQTAERPDRYALTAHCWQPH
jgi:hypothetical protein